MAVTLYLDRQGPRLSPHGPLDADELEAREVLCGKDPVEIANG